MSSFHERKEIIIFIKIICFLSLSSGAEQSFAIEKALQEHC